MMHMAFWCGLYLQDLLLKGLNITTASGLVAVCFGFISLTLVYEGIRVSHEHLTEKASQKTIVLKRNARATRVPEQEEASTERSPLLPVHSHRDTQMGNSEEYISILHKQRLRYLILQTFLHVVQIAVGYCIMLAVMTYNVYIFISVIIGAGLGYFCFGMILMTHTLNISCIPRKQSNEELHSPATHMSSGSCSSPEGAAAGTTDDSVSDPEQDRPRYCHRKERNVLVTREDDSEEIADIIKAVKEEAAAVKGGSSSDHSDTHLDHSVCA